MKILKKALARGLTPTNAISWLSQKIMSFSGRLLGTFFLKIKAALLGVSLGKNVTAHGKVILLRWPGGKIKIGNSVHFISGSSRATACALAFPMRLRVFGPGARISIGDNCQLTGVSITARSKEIILGKNVLVAPNCIITDSDFHLHWPCEKRSEEPGYEKDAPVTIGDYAWIGMNSIILKGVSIGKGAIVGAGSVVTKNIPDYCIACGNPASIVANHSAETDSRI